IWSLRRVSTMIRTTFCPSPAPCLGAFLTPSGRESQAFAPSRAMPAVPTPALFRKSLLVSLRRRALSLSSHPKTPGNAREDIRRGVKHELRGPQEAPSSSHGLLEGEQELLGAGWVFGELPPGEGVFRYSL